MPNKNIGNNKMNTENYQDVISKDSDFYVAQDVDAGGTKIYFNMSREELLENLTQDQNLYEILNEHKPRNFHIDYDAKWRELKTFYEDEGDDYDPTNNLVARVSDCIEDFLQCYNLCEKPIINVLSASDNIKYSFHFNITNVVLANQEDSECFHRKFLEYSQDYDDPTLQFIDSGIYTKNRAMRMFNQSKFGQKRPLTRFSGDDNVESHLISLVDMDNVIKINSSWRRVKKQTVNKIELNLMDEEEFDENEELIELMEHTIHKTIDYNDWIQWVWACCGAKVPRDIIHRYSEMGSLLTYDEDGCDAVIRQFVKQKTTMGIHTLKLWASENGYDVERHVEPQAKQLSVIRQEHSTWVDLLKKYYDKSFDSKIELIEAIKDDVSQVVQKIQGKSFCVYINDGEQFNLVNNLDNLTLYYNESKPDKDKKYKKINLQKLMIDNPLKFPLYNRLVFKPNNHDIKKNELNTWGGFFAQEVNEINMPLIQPILDHFLNVWASGNETNYKYIMSWLAQIIKTPWKKTEVCIVLQGGQGDGKTMPCSFLIDWVFGRGLSLSSTGLGSLTQRFNGSVQSKLFINANELSLVDSESFNNAFDRMKSLITDDIIQVEKKGLEHIQINNHCNFICTTNHTHTIKLESDDRRYAVFETSGQYAKDYDYFANLSEIMKDRGEEAGNSFYQYMLNYPDSEMVNLRKIPMTKVKQDMINMSKINPIRFMEEIHDVVEEALLYDAVVDGKNVATRNNLYIHYVNWCSFMGEKTYVQNKFWMVIKTFIAEEGKNRIKGNVTRWITLK